MASNRVSKIVTDEKSVPLGNGFTMFYGTMDKAGGKTVEINVRGFFSVDKDRPKSQESAIKAGTDLQRRLCSLLDSRPDVCGHYIVSTDLTERGIKPGKGCKLKYQMFLTADPGSDLDTFVREIVGEGNKVVADVIEKHGFVLADGI